MVQGAPDMPHRSCGEEILQPLTDVLIQQCLEVGPWEHNGKPVWHRLLDWALGEGVLCFLKEWPIANVLLPSVFGRAHAQSV